MAVEVEKIHLQIYAVNRLKIKLLESSFRFFTTSKAKILNP